MESCYFIPYLVYFIHRFTLRRKEHCLNFDFDVGYASYQIMRFIEVLALYTGIDLKSNTNHLTFSALSKHEWTEKSVRYTL
ncbi:MAG: hypothetical protein DDT19_00212 [Syntrophomonadaceae bacterium]|nr:hypothetical protein [Bacillota bacterium]